MDVLSIIQARVKSTRLPNKVLLKIQDKTVLEHIYLRVKRSKVIESVIIATSINKYDLPIVGVGVKNNVQVYCGSENDVLDRFYHASRLLNCKHIVRITGDCPLIDPDIIDLVVSNHISQGADYTSNVDPPTYPDGLDVEVITFKALEHAFHNANLSSEREHVTPFIRKNNKEFKCVNVVNRIDLSDKRWTLDEKNDYVFVKSIYKNLYNRNKYFKMKDILKFIKENPEIEKINENINRNEGYIKSIKND